MNCVRKRLGGSRKQKRKILQFTVIAALSETASPSGFVKVICWEPAARPGGEDGERVHDLEGNGGGLPFDGDRGGAVKAAAANG